MDITKVDSLSDNQLENLLNTYMEVRPIVLDDQKKYRDFQELKKLPINDVEDFVSGYTSVRSKKQTAKIEGAEKLYEDSDWLVYKITKYPAAVEYGKGTKWCITGRYEGHEERGEEYFYDYINDKDLDGGYYFYINKKNPSEKYCVLQTKDKEIDSIWAKDDTNIGSGIKKLNDYGVILPEVKEINLRQFSVLDLNDAIDNNYLITDYLLKMIDSFDVETLNKYHTLARAIISDSRKDKDRVLKKLLEKGVCVTSDILSGSANNWILLKFLISNGIDVDINSKNSKGYTQLFFASCIYKDYDCTEILLKHGADPNIKNKGGKSVLGETKDPKIEELIIQYGAKE